MLDCLVDGELSDCVAPDDRGLAYGDGLFETLVVDRGRPRFWQGHMDRLAEGCRRLGIEAPGQGVLLREVQTVAAGEGRCVVKILLTRGSAGRGYGPAEATRPRRVVSAHPWPLSPEQEAALRRGVRVRICRLRLAIQPALGGMKHLNRLEQVLARAEWDDPDIAEGLLLDPEDHLVSAVAANLFLVSNGRLLTPRLDRCGVRGVLRAQVLHAFKSRCEQRRLTLDMLPEADEVFLCSSVRGIVPVRRVDHWEFEVGPITREVMHWHEEAVEA